MFIDARTLPENQAFQVDVAIIGAGAAGITIARELAGTRLSVLMIESGGYEYDRDNNSLYDGENVGLPYADLATTRLRYFGGSTNHWGGWCRPLDPIDFEARDWVPYSGWPFGRAELDPYYQRAQVLVEAGPFAYDDEDHWLPVVGGKLAVRTNELDVGFFQYSPPTRFGERYRDDIRRAKNLRCLLNANLIEIHTEETGRHVTRLDLACLDGKRLTAAAKYIVLAAGGIENPRLLLLSNRVNPNGLGNSHDLVGRFFMDHPHLAPARLLVTPRDTVMMALMDEFRTEEAHVRPCLLPSAGFLRRTQGLGLVATAGSGTRFGADGFPVGNYDPTEDDDNTMSLRRAIASLARRLDPIGTAEADSDIPGAIETVVGLATEPMPNPDSRVLLGDDLDRFGQRKVKLDWRLTPDDLPILRRTLRSFSVAFGKAALGHLQYRHPGGGDWPGFIGWGNHHMGTTRMSNDPRQGVVDADARMHEVDNVFIAGSSVFPTGGAANPTLTIVALSLRLADHLRKIAA